MYHTVCTWPVEVPTAICRGPLNFRADTDGKPLILKEGDSKKALDFFT